jgi:hypothetical protein
VTEETKLVELCHGRHELLQGAFTLPGGESMIVGDLKGKDEAGWEAFVAGKGGPDGLVSGWLKEKGLRRFLDGYMSPTITKKAKSGDDSGSGSSSSASPGKRTCFLFLYFGLTFCRSLSSQEPLWECHG